MFIMIICFCFYPRNFTLKFCQNRVSCCFYFFFAFFVVVRQKKLPEKGANLGKKGANLEASPYNISVIHQKMNTKLDVTLICFNRDFLNYIVYHSLFWATSVYFS